MRNLNKRIVFFANTSWYIFHFYNELILELKGKGCDIIVIAPDKAYFEQLNGQGVKCEFIPISRKGLNPFLELYSLYLIYKVFKKLKPDFVFNFTIKPNIYSGLVCQFLNISYSNTISGMGSTYIRGGIIKQISKFFYYLGCRTSKSNFVLNNDDYKILKSYGVDNICKVPGTGIDFNKYNQLTKELNEKIKILFVGRLLKDKGIFELLDAFSSSQLSDIELHIVGDVDEGNPSSLTHRDIKEYSRDNIIFHGYQKDVNKFFELVDFTILPSYREGLPRVLMESLSKGIPILGSNVCGCKDLIKHEINGFIFEPQSSDAIIDTIMNLSNLSNSEYSSMSMNAHLFAVENLDIKTVIDKYCGVIQE